MRRRVFLSGTILTGIGLPVLTGCKIPGWSKNKGGPTSSSGSLASTGGKAKAGSTDWQELDAHVMGHKVAVRVSPVIRKDEATSIMALELTRAKDDASIDDIDANSYSDNSNKLNISNYLGVPSIFRPGTGASGAKLLDLNSGRVWSAINGSGVFLDLTPGEKITSYLSFGKVDADTVTVLVPMAGFTTVSVLEADAAKKADVNLTTAQTAIDQSTHAAAELADPVAIERYTRALDDSTSTHAGGKDITVTLASDVTFASDSAELASGAEAQLQTVASQLKQHPDGGTLTIVGHTDDVQDDAYNQTLSEKRANAVKTRLEQLTKLDKWQTTVSGKGESEPRINDTTDEARAVNRRVEITLTPTGGTTPKNTTPAPSSGGGKLPDPKGPVAKGSDGVTVKNDSGDDHVTITIDHVTRQGGYLLGQLHTTISAKKNSAPNLHLWFKDKEIIFITNSRGEDGSDEATIYAADGLTLLAGGERIYPADYRDADFKTHVPLTELQLTPFIKAGTTTICVIWPDPGGDTITLDHLPAAHLGSSFAYRLTDIPIKNG